MTTEKESCGRKKQESELQPLIKFAVALEQNITVCDTTTKAIREYIDRVRRERRILKPSKPRVEKSQPNVHVY